MENLASKYRPQTLDDVVEQDVVVDIVKNICRAPEITNRNFLFIGPAGTGKAELLTNKILTTSGFKMMKDIQIGDEVFTGRGNRGKVIGIYPQGKRPIYRITLQDRTYIDVSDEHLNVFYRYNQDSKQREDYCMTTTELIDFFEQSRFKLRVDIPEVDWDEANLPIDPYLLGALIGDGSLSNNLQFSNSEEDVVEKVDSILRRDWNKMLRKVPGDNVDYDIVDVNHVTTKYTFSYEDRDYKTSELQKLFLAKGYPMFDADSLIKLASGTGSNLVKRYPELVGKITFTINDNYRSWTEGDPFRNTLKQLKLLCRSSEKQIPQEYLLTCKEARIALLQGLYDTDGYTDKEGLTYFTTTSLQLSNDFAFLVRSLGIRDTVCSYPAKYKLRGQAEYIYTGETAYDHNIKIPNSLQYCTSEKHCSLKRIRQNPPMRNIISIEYLEEAECQCIMIDHDDHTYISGDGLIPTHNTTTARAIARELNDGSLNNVIELDAASHSGVNDMRELTEQMRTYPIGSKYKTFIIDECHSISSVGWQSLLKTLEEQPARSLVMLATTNPEKIPATILSRVQTFQLSKISLDSIFNRLKYIIEEENKEGRNITYDEAAILYISKMAQGGMRDAITSLDTCLSFSTDLTIDVVSQALGLPNYDDYFELLNAIASKNNEKIVQIINIVYNSGVNFVKWFDGFFGFVINIVKFIYLKDINQTMIPSTYQEKIAGYSTAHSALCLKLSNKLVKMNQELKTTQYLQELAISYLCTPPSTKG